MPRGMIALQGLNVDLGKSINEGLALREKYDQWKAKKGYEADIDAADKQYQSAIAANESIGKAKEAYAQGDMAKADEAIADAFYEQAKSGTLKNTVAIDPATGQLKRTELATPTQDGKWKMNDAAMPATSQLSAENRRALDYQKALSRYHMGVGDVKNAAAAKQQEERLAWRHGWTELDNDRPALLRKLAPYAALAMGDGSTFKVNDDGSVIRHTPDGKDVPFELNEAQLQQFKMQAMAYDAVSRFGEFDFLKNLTEMDKNRAAINESNAKAGYYTKKSEGEKKVYPFGIPGAESRKVTYTNPETGEEETGEQVYAPNVGIIAQTRTWAGGRLVPYWMDKKTYDGVTQKVFKQFGSVPYTVDIRPGTTVADLYFKVDDSGLLFNSSELDAGMHLKKGDKKDAKPAIKEQDVGNGNAAKATPATPKALRAIAHAPTKYMPNDETPFNTGNDPMFVAPGEVKPAVPGNIDLANRPQVKLKDGSTATVWSVSVNIGGKEVLLPKVTEDGRVISTKEAVAKFKKDKKHLGIFDTPEQATAYAEQLHKQQEDMYVKPRKYMTYEAQ